MQYKQTLISFSHSHSRLRAHTLRLGLPHLLTSPSSSNHPHQLSLNSLPTASAPVRHASRRVVPAPIFVLSNTSLTPSTMVNGEALSTLFTRTTQARVEAASTTMRPARRECAHYQSVGASSKT
jgi:hypothetical protein